MLHDFEDRNTLNDDDDDGDEDVHRFLGYLTKVNERTLLLLRLTTKRNN